MVVFNGYDLQQISNDLHVIDVVVGAPEIDNTTIQPALRDGALFARTKYKPRPITITFVVMDRDMERRRNIINQVMIWARRTNQGLLNIPQEPDGTITVTCSKLPQVAAREYWQPLTVEFMAYDPFFHAYSMNYVDINTVGIINVQKYDNPDWIITQTISSGLREPMWGLGSQQLSFVAIGSGELTIDRSKQTADLNGQSVLPSLYYGSRFFDLKAGTNIVQTSGGAHGRFMWRERWL